MGIFDTLKNNFYDQIIEAISYYGPRIVGALSIILIGILLSVLIYKLIIHISKKFKLMGMLDRLVKEFTGISITPSKINKGKKTDKSVVNEDLDDIKVLSEKIPIDRIVAKAISYYIFLIFFRFSIIAIGITEVEQFLGDLINYLPKLFLGIIIGFFGIRFATFIYDIVFNALDLAKQKTAKIVASGAKIIVLFFTLMVALNYIGIVDEVINTILIGFISMLAIAGGLAFGLGGKDIAREILEGFRK